MRTYRLYRVDEGGRLSLLGSFQAVGDQAAAETATQLAPFHAAELWESGRLVGQLSKLGVFTPST